jgi:superoxide dismutase, Fe-Mn family
MLKSITMETNIAITRRKFLAGLGIGAGALGLSTLTSACNKEPVSSRDDNLYPIFNGTEYIAKDFSHLTKNSSLGLSPEIVLNHIGLYKGYVEKVNKAEAMMRNNQVDEFSLQHLAFSLNGMALHDIYFTNMNTEKTSRSQSLNKAIEENFGSFDNYYNNLVSIAERVQGWSITGLNLLNGKLFNYGEDTHSSNFPNYFMPILALDVYDHAYVMDFGEEGKAEYINAWTKVIDWDLVSRRFDVIKSL